LVSIILRKVLGNTLSRAILKRYEFNWALIGMVVRIYVARQPFWIKCDSLSVALYGLLLWLKMRASLFLRMFYDRFK
jgi:hypothetical protein